MPELVLALDQGTTSSRSILFDHAGEPRASAQLELSQSYPHPGWVEHDPEEIVATQVETAAAALRAAGAGAADLAAVGLTNQRETTVLWERGSGRAVAPAIVWQDRRTAPAIERLRAAGVEELVRQRTGLVLDPYFSATKLGWLLDHVPGARERAGRGELAFGTVDSWLLYRLTGGAVHATDVSNAARTLLFDIHRLDWDDELLEIFAVPRELLPAVCSCSEVLGETAIAGLPAGLPIAGMAGDQQAATFGQAAFARGAGKCTYGTGAFMVLNTGAEAVPSQHRLLTTVAWRIGEQVTYALEGSIFIAGAVVQWLRDGLGILAEAADVEALAASVDDSGGVVLVPAFVGLGAPHWDHTARGTILGITRGTTRAHVARAALDAIALQVADIVTAMAADSGVPLAELRADGGAAANDLLLGIQADLLGVPVVRPRILETTALGAAYLAGLATGFWRDTAELARHWHAAARFEPRLGDAERRRRLERWHEAVDRARGWARED